jgi:hypothetical protein
MDRVETIIWNQWRATAAPTRTNIVGYEIARDAFKPWYDKLNSVLKTIEDLEEQLNAGKAPYTPGRLPYWEAN